MLVIDDLDCAKDCTIKKKRATFQCNSLIFGAPPLGLEPRTP